MLLRLASLGALAYLGYRLAQTSASPSASGEPADVRLAGGPLSPQATLQHTPDAPPV